MFASWKHRSWQIKPFPKIFVQFKGVTNFAPLQAISQSRNLSELQTPCWLFLFHFGVFWFRSLTKQVLLVHLLNMNLQNINLLKIYWYEIIPKNEIIIWPLSDFGIRSTKKKLQSNLYMNFTKDLIYIFWTDYGVIRSCYNNIKMPATGQWADIYKKRPLLRKHNGYILRLHSHLLIHMNSLSSHQIWLTNWTFF